MFIVKGGATEVFQKILVANRGEIANRIIRACHELGIKAVAVYAQEDEYSTHRFAADEAYLIGKDEQPIDAYLDIDEIIRVAKQSGAQAIHPGYGFLSENAGLAQACADNGIKFIGPKVEHLKMFGDKLTAKHIAQKAGLHTIPGMHGDVKTVEQVRGFAHQYGYPIMVKAAMGGGGRGMRIIKDDQQLDDEFEQAKDEAKKAFGSDEMYVEKDIVNPKHIEVQVIADEHGHVMHLFERDCSVQRRNQKVIEFAPSVVLSPARRKQVCDMAVQLMKSVGYQNAATVEFLETPDDFYFIEVNPRVQVEHTITEMITGVDIVKTQIRVAAGEDLYRDIHLPKQDELEFHGCAIQCRVTTEDPENNFMPDTGQITNYNSPGGNGVRLDGNAYAGYVVTPYFDSLLVKCIVKARNFADANKKMQRALNEFNIRGVKTNIPFMLNVLRHPTFEDGNAKTTFIDTTPELFHFKHNPDVPTQLIRYIGDVTINGFAGVTRHEKVKVPRMDVPDASTIKADQQAAPTIKDVLDQQGAAAAMKAVLDNPRVMMTDTTMRDAHQSLFATRMRTFDMLPAMKVYDKAMPHLFSTETWGGATFDVCYRFLGEDPWKRLAALTHYMPHTMQQMLLRASNAVGYQNYPDNALKQFLNHSAQSGIDVFRIFDSLNWIEQMQRPIAYARETGKIAEGTMCYTGDLLDLHETKYTLDYYLQLASQLVDAGSQIIAIKDMAGLLKPQAAFELVGELKAKLNVPIHLHTHDTTGNGIATYVAATKAGVDVVDVAMSSMAGTTSQPSMQTFYQALEGDKRQPELNLANSQVLDKYWSEVRPLYKDFSNGIDSPKPELYATEMPGGQYSNLKQQAKSIGIDDFTEVEEKYREVNDLLGNIIKVTPSSKVVGDMAIFMIQNHLDKDNVLEKGKTMDFPDSVVNFFAGDLGQPYGGFPRELQKVVLKDRQAITVRPGSLAKPIDFDAVKAELADKIHRQPTEDDVLGYVMYPKVFTDYVHNSDVYGRVGLLDTTTFYQGMRPGETIHITLGKGKQMILTYLFDSAPDAKGVRTLHFAYNGKQFLMKITDNSLKNKVKVVPKADPDDPNQIGMPLSGNVVKVNVQPGDTIKTGEVMVVTEAMKMETNVKAPFSGTVKSVTAKVGDQLDDHDLLLTIETK
jgi:pyruvate carboxylase